MLAACRVRDETAAAASVDAGSLLRGLLPAGTLASAAPPGGEADFGPGGPPRGAFMASVLLGTTLSQTFAVAASPHAAVTFDGVRDGEHGPAAALTVTITPPAPPPPRPRDSDCDGVPDDPAAAAPPAPPPFTFTVLLTPGPDGRVAAIDYEGFPPTTFLPDPPARLSHAALLRAVAREFHAAVREDRPPSWAASAPATALAAEAAREAAATPDG